MDRTIGSVAVWPVFIVLFKFIFRKDFIPLRAAGAAAAVAAPASVAFSIQICSWKRLESCTFCAWPSSAPMRKGKLFDTMTRTEQQQLPIQLRKSNLVGLLWGNAESVWHSFFFFFYLLQIFFSSLVYDLLVGGGYGIPLVVRWSVEEKCEVWGKGNGCYDVIVHHPTPLALRIALQPQFSVFSSSPLLFPLMELSQFILCEREGKKN